MKIIRPKVDCSSDEYSLSAARVSSNHKDKVRHNLSILICDSLQGKMKRSNIIQFYRVLGE